MFGKIFFPRKTAADYAALAVAVRAQTGCFWVTVFVVDFSLMSVEAAWISKALDSLTADYFADVGTSVLIHVLSTYHILSVPVKFNSVERPDI